jgi:hypothetical protein
MNASGNPALRRASRAIGSPRSRIGVIGGGNAPSHRAKSSPPENRENHRTAKRT